jgi:DNA-directed RNA polymerase specialized sigma24 family protein
VLVLRFYGDLPDAEIAALIGCRVGTVSSAASRAMATLRRDRSLSPDLDEDQT